MQEHTSTCETDGCGPQATGQSEPRQQLVSLAGELDAALVQAFDAFDAIPTFLGDGTDPRCGAKGLFHDMLSSYRGSSIYQTLASNLVEVLVQRARFELAVPGVDFPITTNSLEFDYSTAKDRYNRHTRSDREWWEGFNASWALDRIFEKYQPEAWRKQQCNDAANTLVRRFDLYRGAAPRLVRGKVELVHAIYPGDAYVTRGNKRLESGWGQSTSKALEVMLTQPENAEICAKWMSGLNTFLWSGMEYRSRERIAIGRDFEAVMFHREMKLYVPEAFAEALNLFISEWASESVLDRKGYY